VNVYTPLDVYVTPFQVYESHAVAVASPMDELELIVKFSVAVLTQPAAFNDVNVYTPLFVYVAPFHVYELHAVVVKLPFVEL
jgi:hypothetical protein